MVKLSSKGTLWLLHSQFAMERSTHAIKNGKPSISIRAIYTMAMLVITRWYIILIRSWVSCELSPVRNQSHLHTQRQHVKSTRLTLDVHDMLRPGFMMTSPQYGYGSKLGTPKLWMVNTKLDFHICGPINGLPF